jgi:hypothetical protein
MNEAAIPNDADGDAMRRVIASGANLSRPMKIDFQVAAPSEEAARRVAVTASEKGFAVQCYVDKEGGKWTCECSQTMLLIYRDMLRIQKELNLLSRPFGGYADGWGTFGNEDEANHFPEPPLRAVH